MLIREYMANLDGVTAELYALPEIYACPSWGEMAAGFRRRAAEAVKLMFLEKEIFFFAALQWCVAAAGAAAWAVSAGVAAGAGSADPRAGLLTGFILPLLLLVLFSAGAAFPVWLLTGCMGAAHFLHKQGKESTVLGCLRIVLPKARTLLEFNWINIRYGLRYDLGKGGGRRNSREKEVNRDLHEAWKLGAAGILPALLTGRGLLDAGRRSVDFLKAKAVDVVIVKAMYQLFCKATIGIVCAGLLLFFTAGRGAPGKAAVLQGVLALIAAGAAILMLLRPVYIISLCGIYSDYISEKGEGIMLPEPPAAA